MSGAMRKVTVQCKDSRKSTYRCLILSINEYEEENEKRRTPNAWEFFKQAAKGALPILGAVMLSAVPSFLKAESTESMGCRYGCTGGCDGSCTSCQGQCQGTCKEGCVGGCKDRCYPGCKGTCEGGCQGSCKGGCQYSCAHWNNA